MSAATQEVRRRFFAPLQKGIEPGARWLEYLARAGYLAKGIVYGIVGLLALQAAFTVARSPDTDDALETIRTAPFGRILLGLIAIGLLAYFVWRLAQAWYDTERKGKELKGIAIRIGYAISAFAYLGLGSAAGMAALSGGSTNSGGSSDQQRAAQVLSWPGGWLLLLVAGLIVLGVGIAYFRRAYKADFMHEYEHTEMSATERKYVKPIGQFGLSARGVTFCIIGIFLALGGWSGRSGEVKSLGEAFTVIAAQPFGQVLLVIIALGFVAYGVFCVSQAKYRRIEKV